MLGEPNISPRTWRASTFHHRCFFAAWALQEGVAEAEAIDTIARLGFAHPLGPLALADLIGLDTCVAIMEVLESGLGNHRYAPAPLLREHVAAGRLGRKTGRGFFEYS